MRPLVAASVWVAVSDAAVGGSMTDHRDPSPLSVALYVVLSNDTSTPVSPASQKPQTWARAGARCNTMWEVCMEAKRNVAAGGGAGGPVAFIAITRRELKGCVAVLFSAHSPLPFWGLCQTATVHLYLDLGRAL